MGNCSRANAGPRLQPSFLPSLPATVLNAEFTKAVENHIRSAVKTVSLVNDWPKPAKVPSSVQQRSAYVAQHVTSPDPPDYVSFETGGRLLLLDPAVTPEKVVIH